MTDASSQQYRDVMPDHRRSFRKTLVILSAALFGMVAVVGWFGFAVYSHTLPAPLSWWPVTVVLALVGLALLLGLVLAIAGGLLALGRDTLEEQGIPYAISRPREWLPGPVVRSMLDLWRSLRRLFSSSETRLRLRPGELVEIKSLEEILETLDHRGTLDALPFMPEMAAFCGRQARVFRRVEKLNDWVHKTGLHRVRDTVLLDNLRCDGSGHDGCLASCHIRWKEGWLRRVQAPARSSKVSSDPARLRPTDLQRLARPVTTPGEERYVCQATELTAGAPRIAARDPMPYLRELLVGNVRLLPFLTGWALAMFNWIQRKRGGALFPVYYAMGVKPTPQQILDLRPGELVRVKTKREIGPTLDAESRNRGLRFDPEMIRFCGGEFQVLSRADRLMVEKTGTLMNVKNACIILKGVTATGEYVAFNPENESVFWREIWLERAGGASKPGSP